MAKAVRNFVNKFMWIYRVSATYKDIYTIVTSFVATRIIEHVPKNLQGKLGRRKFRAKITINGRIFNLRYRANWGDIYTLFAIFKEEEYALPRASLGRVGTVVDLGANIGMAAVYLSTIFPNARFTCVEPDPDNLALLRENLEANRINANIVPLAVGSTRGTTNLYRYRAADAHSLSPQPRPDLLNVIQVQAVPLADILREAGVQEVDLLKIDVEGAEEEILADAQGWLPRVRAVVMEIHPDLVSASRLIDIFRDNGFTYFARGSWTPRADAFLREKLACNVRLAGSHHGRALPALVQDLRRRASPHPATAQSQGPGVATGAAGRRLPEP